MLDHLGGSVPGPTTAELHDHITCEIRLHLAAEEDRAGVGYTIKDTVTSELIAMGTGWLSDALRNPSEWVLLASEIHTVGRRYLKTFPGPSEPEPIVDEAADYEDVPGGAGTSPDDYG